MRGAPHLPMACLQTSISSLFLREGTVLWIFVRMSFILVENCSFVSLEEAGWPGVEGVCGLGWVSLIFYISKLILYKELALTSSCSAF